MWKTGCFHATGPLNATCTAPPRRAQRSALCSRRSNSYTPPVDARTAALQASSPQLQSGPAHQSLVVIARVFQHKATAFLQSRQHSRPSRRRVQRGFHSSSPHIASRKISSAGLRDGLQRHRRWRFWSRRETPQEHGSAALDGFPKPEQKSSVGTFDGCE